MLELILGGARSGKSALAVSRAAASERKVTFIATARATDAEMHERIERHRCERPVHWRTCEAPVQLAQAIEAAATGDSLIVVDCLTLWLANVLYADGDSFMLDETGWQHARAALVDVLRATSADVVLVSNEIGLGLVPETAVGRRFRDEQGRLNQTLAALCDHVTLVVAGLPVTVK